MPGAGKLEIKFTPDNGDKPMEFTIFDFKESGGVAMGMFNTDAVSVAVIGCKICLVRGTWWLNW